MAENLTTYRGTPTFAAQKFGNGLSGGSLQASASAWNIPVGTVECWVKVSSTSGVKVFLGLRGSWVGTNNGVVVVSPGSGLYSSGVDIRDGLWHHVAYTVDGTNAKLWIDGTLTVTQAYAGGITSGSDTAALGGFYLDFIYEWSADGGVIDEVRFSSTVRYAAAFTPPTAAFTDDADTVSLYHLETDGTDSHSISGVHPVAGTVAASSGMSGAITSNQRVAGQVDAVSDAQGTLYVPPTGTDWPVSGQVDAISGAQGSVGLRAKLAGTVGAVSGVSGKLVGTASETASVGLRIGITATDSAVTLAHSTASVGLRLGITTTDRAIDAIESAHVGLRINIRPHTTRDWGVDPRTPGRPAPSVVVATRDGVMVAPLPDVEIAPVSTGVGVRDRWTFSVDRDDPRGKLIEPVGHDIHIYRGNVLMSKGPAGPGRLDRGRMVHDVSDPRQRLDEGRYITRIPQLNWCYNGDFSRGTQGWAGGYDAGSAPEAAPKMSVVEEAESTSGKGLRIEGVDKVVTSKAVVETAAVFYPNRPYAWEPLADGFLSGGEQKIRDATTNIPQDATVTVEGHTADADAGDGYLLSVRRADAARNVILAFRPDLTVTAVGKGETEPVATNSTLEGQAKNRRVEILWTGTVTATGHRQFVWQEKCVSNPESSKVPLPVTVAGRMRIGEWLGAPKDGWALRVMLMQGPTIVTDPGGQPIEATASMSEATPRERWHDYSATIDIPPDGITYRLVWRLYPPAGWAVWADVGVYPHEQLGFFDIDQALIVKALTEHVQDPAFGHGDLGIGTRTPLTGITRTKEYEFAKLWPYSSAVEELVAPAKGVEVDCEVTPATATIVTHYPRQGSPAGPSLTHGGARSIVKAYKPLPSVTRELASSLIVQSWGYNSNRIMQYARDPNALAGTLMEHAVQADADSPPSELDELAAQSLARMIHPTAAWEVALDPSRTSEILDAIGKGDTVLLSLPDEGVHGLHRVVLITWDPATDGLTLQLAPEEA